MNSVDNQVAIVGMAGRFPGAGDIDEFWQNLVGGVESVTFFSDDELRAAGVPESDITDPNYVKAGPILPDGDMFDPGFFAMTAREAEVLDPQHRIFLEVCERALQHAGYDYFGYPERIGVYGGVGFNNYLDDYVNKNPDVVKAVGKLATNISNVPDYLATGVAFRLGLSGPAFTCLSACSTSLVAVHLACQALSAGDCEMALAGGVEEFIPRISGYFYAEGSLYSPDGHCRTFDAKARGTVFGSGAGAVLLKRLDKALADGDNVLGIIRGSAINNDGADKGAFTAPSVAGQFAAISAAIRRSQIDPATLSYVEAHGTSTFVGDPIEVTALTQAFRAHTDRKQYCGIGSVKTNVGHLGAAAGVTGLIKTVLAMQHRVIPPHINFDEPNPQIDFESSPFYLPTDLTPWKSDNGPLRASVSSFGVGGTNAHCVIEEAPPLPAPAGSAKSHQVILLSAHTPTALESSATGLGEHLRAHPAEFADAAYTLAVGRPQRNIRSFLVARDAEEAADRLTAGVPLPSPGVVAARGVTRPVAFVFPGQGAQYPGMGRDLYDHEPVFRQEIDACARVLEAHIGEDLRQLLFPAAQADSQERLNQTAVTQPALFAVEYAMAKLLQSWGLQPEAMVGHSIGEYVAACLAGVWSRDDALMLVAARGALMQQMPGGSMLAVPISADVLTPMLPEGLDLAAVNAPDLCVVAGADTEVAEFAETLSVQGLTGRPLHTSHAFHSAMMDPIVEQFRQLVAEVPRHEPTVPFISNVTGDWITDAQAMDPAYWATHLRSAVRFGDAVTLLVEGAKRVLVEVGPGQTLTTLARRQLPADRHGLVVPTMRHPQQRQPDTAVILTALGQVWQAGAKLDTAARWQTEQRRRVALPPVPYERQRCWVDPLPASEEAGDVAVTETGPYYVPIWRETALPAPAPVATDATWLVFEDRAGSLVGDLVTRLRAAGAHVITVRPGDAPAADPDGAGFVVRARESGDYQPVVSAALANRPERLKVVHGWLVDDVAGDTVHERARAGLDRGFFAMLAMVQAISRNPAVPALDVYLLTAHARDVVGGEPVEPSKCGVDGIVSLLPKEFSNTTCRTIDVAGGAPQRLGEQVLRELTSGEEQPTVAYRGRKRWVRSHQEVSLDSGELADRFLRERGVYVITGGLGGIGLVTAKDLAERHQARMVLVGRSPLPPRDQWADYLADHPADDPTSQKIIALQEVEEHGGEFRVVSADITDIAQVGEVKRVAEEAFGRVDGVLHAAGITGGGMLETRAAEDAEKVMAAKVFGTLALAEVFGDDLELFVLYSSFTVFAGDFGLGDYGSANAIMDAYAHARAGDRTHVVSINWPIWKKLGMAYSMNAPDVLTNFEMGDRYEKVSHPLLSSRLTRHGVDAVTFVKTLSTSDWVADEHRLGGFPTLPGTSLVEIVRAAYEEVTGETSAELRNVVFQHPLLFQERKTVHIILTPMAGGGYEAVVADPVDGTKYTSAKVGPAPAEPRPTHDVAQWHETCHVEDDPEGEVDQTRLTFGPRWKSIERHWSSPQRANGLFDELVLLHLPEQYHGDLAEFGLHPALLDKATALGQTIISSNLAHLPFGYDRIVVRGPLPARFYSYIQHLDDTASSMIRSDITLADCNGTEIAAIKGFTMIEYDGVPEPEPDHAGEAPDGAGETQLDAADQMMFGMVRYNERDFGIEAEDGYGLLRDILDSGVAPQIIVCPDSFSLRLRLAAEVTRDALREQIAAAPVVTSSVSKRNLITPYTEPETDVQRVLCGILAESLGVDMVGVDDDFFDLNGNSLVAVQVVAQIRERFQVDVTVAALFEQRTPRGVAEVVEALLVESLQHLSDEEAAAKLATLQG